MIIKLRLSIFLFLFLLSNIISTLVMVFPVILTLSLCVNLVTILYGGTYLLYQNQNTKKKGVFFYTYALWVVIMILIGMDLDIRTLGRFFSNPESAFFLLFPLLIYKPLTPEFFETLYKYLIISNIIYLIFIALTYNQILADLNFYEFISKRFAFGNTFLLLTYGFLSPRRKLLSIFIFIITLIIALTLARRAQIFYLGISGLFAWCIFVFYFKKKYILINILMGILISSAIFFNFDQLFKTHFAMLANRIDDDTRSVVEKDFYNDMGTLDWAAGKGINGKFKTSFLVDLDYDGDTRNAEDKNFRFGIETGYLNTILKGGIVKLVLDLSIILYAIFLGLFYSKNLLSKAAVLFLLIYLATLYPENANAFNLRYLLVWLCVAVCLNKTMRKLSNAQIFEQYFYNGK